MKEKHDFKTDANFRRVEQDGMPAEVATELLLTGGLRTNRERKVAAAALATMWESTRQRKDDAKKLHTRLSAATLAQLGKWLTRTEHRYIRIQHKYQRVCVAADALAADTKLTANQRAALAKALEQQKAAITVIGSRLEGVLTSLEDAIRARNEAPRRRENLARTCFQNVVIARHKLVGVELHFDPQSLLA
jgi:hypothetical protein